jgi:molybdopterin molybdotransferase
MKTTQTEAGCDKISQPLINSNDALLHLLNAAQPIERTQYTSLDNALDKILSQEVVATINVPEFNNSAMDGYALFLKKSQINQSGVLNFPVVLRVTAGEGIGEIQAGECARIFTGAPIPKGANTVIMQEECELSPDKKTLETWRPLNLNDNIRPKGNDITAGDVVLKKGQKLSAQDIALCASLGERQLLVFAPITVGVFFTGNELIEPGNTLKTGQIYNSNRYALVALLKKLNCEIINLGCIKDTLDTTIGAIQTLEKKCDLIITTGGVSVGEEDHVKSALESLGELNLWRIKMKPGKPLAFGKVNKCAFIGLPGNPVSAMVTFMLFACPFIKKMQGANHYHTPVRQVKIDFNWLRPKPRREFVRVKINNNIASLYPKQGSDVLSSMVWADGLLEIPEDKTFKTGDNLNFYAFNEILT